MLGGVGVLGWAQCGSSGVGCCVLVQGSAVGQDSLAQSLLVACMALPGVVLSDTVPASAPHSVLAVAIPNWAQPQCCPGWCPGWFCVCLSVWFSVIIALPDVVPGLVLRPALPAAVPGSLPSLMPGAVPSAAVPSQCPLQHISAWCPVLCLVWYPVLCSLQQHLA